MGFFSQCEINFVHGLIRLQVQQVSYILQAISKSCMNGVRVVCVYALGYKELKCNVVA